MPNGTSSASGTCRDRRPSPERPREPDVSIQPSSAGGTSAATVPNVAVDLAGTNVVAANGGNVQVALPGTGAVLTSAAPAVGSGLTAVAAVGVDITALANTAAVQVNAVLHNTSDDARVLAGVLVNSCHQTLDQVCAPLHQAGYAVNDIAVALQGLGCASGEIATMLKVRLGCTTAEVATALHGIGSTATEVGGALYGAGCRATDVAGALMTTFGCTAAQVGTVLRSFGCTGLDVGSR